MIDLGRIAGFQWDTGNARKSEDRHGVTQAEAEQIFFGEQLVVLFDTGHSGDERRFHALGRTDDGSRLHITFTLRESDTLIRVISARDMSRRERRYYEQD